MKLYARISLPFFLLAAYACGDDDTMGYTPSTGGQDATVTSDTGATPVADSGAVKTDSATAPDTGVVTDTGTTTADTGAAVDAATSPCSAANTFAVTNNGFTDYVFSRNGGAAENDPNIGVVAGTRYCFDIQTPGHPFYIKNVQGTGTANALPGVTNNGTDSGVIVYTPAGVDGSVFYNCSLHSGMTGSFVIAL